MTVLRSRKAEHGARVSALGLLGLTIVKGTAGWLTGSKALIADACHSAADFASVTTSYLSVKKAGCGSRESSRAERMATDTIACVILSALLLVAGLEIGLSSIKKMVGGVDESPGWVAAAVIVFGIAVREALVRYRRSQVSKLGIRTDALRTESRSDIFASLTALVGTVGAMAGDMFEMPVLYVLDPAAGVVIGVFVIRSGCLLVLNLARSADHEALNEVDVQALLEAVQRVDGVVAVDGLTAKEHGHYVVVDMIIRVNPRISVSEGHDIALRVRRHLTKRFLHVTEANVHVQPYDPGYPYKSNHQDEEMTSLLQ
ncbi:cation diffusion facilitator family transporter [Cohnella lubricantis]|uniref:Cation transporter n=1 Tax=Cohnella lubricantis TaxID=2163172 RepID=A0A841TFB0_9BACL|nr:cation diffusion facilitator family transporter [Cohnella lubricantis]MBB6677647.1 cation transporter [Cohnella lubricantis]MBP2116465.1 cation diffusion facilitator family transporter [Cohnella lubricantis]